MKGSRSPVRAALRCLAVVSAGALLAGYVYVAQSRAWKSPIHGTKSTRVLDDLRIPEAGGDAKVRAGKNAPMVMSGSKSGIITTTIEAGALPLHTVPAPADIPPQRPPPVMPGSKGNVLSELLPPGWVPAGSIQLQIAPPPKNAPPERSPLLMSGSKSLTLSMIASPQNWLTYFFKQPYSKARTQFMLDRLKDEGIELYSDPGIGEIPKLSAPFTESKPLLTLDVMPFDGTLSPPLNGSSAPLPGGILPMPIIPLAPPTLVQPVEK